MIDMIKIYPYKQGSASVKKLKTELNALEVKLENSRCRYRAGQTIINWGNSRRPSWMSIDVPVLNKPEDVAIASNKLLTLEKLEEEGVPTVPFSTEEMDASTWLAEGYKVYVRHSLTGHSGEGIEVLHPIADTHEEINSIANRLLELGYQFASEYVLDQYEAPYQHVPEAELYTMGVKNHGEYRVHVFNGEVILYQKKSRRVDSDGEVETPEGEEDDVRNLASNWVYRTGDLLRLERIEELAINAVQALGLDFGAVDIIKDEKGDVFVLEVNTAPGLGNEETLQAYATAITSHSTGTTERQ